MPRELLENDADVLFFKESLIRILSIISSSFKINNVIIVS